MNDLTKMTVPEVVSLLKRGEGLLAKCWTSASNQA